MNVDQLIEKLQQISKEGYGARPVRLQIVEDGITYAEHVTDVWPADPHDGDIVWMSTGERENPEWAGGADPRAVLDRT